MARRKKSKKEIPLLILIIAIIGYIFATYGENLSSSLTEEGNLNQNNVTTDLKVYFFDVGQADSILISNNNHHLLIDAPLSALNDLCADVKLILCGNML